MQVTLVRRWGPYQAGKVCEVSDSQGQWLVQHSYAEGGPSQDAAVPGAHGPDPLAGGDATRLRPHVPRSTGSTAHQATGSSPTYRAGYTAADAANEGPVGRGEPAASESPAPASGKTSRRKTSK